MPTLAPDGKQVELMASRRAAKTWLTVPGFLSASFLCYPGHVILWQNLAENVAFKVLSWFPMITRSTVSQQKRRLVNLGKSPV